MTVKRLGEIKIFKLTIDRDKCTLCETCVDICPTEALACKNDKIIVIGDCERCEICKYNCQVDAITTEWVE